MVDLSSKATKHNKEQLAKEKLKVQEMKKGRSIITSEVKTAVKNILQYKVVYSLWKTQKFLHLGKQGTSQNEAVHAYISACKNAHISRQNYDTLQLHLGVLFYFFNKK
jgi:hypothetical protein